jgi:hypothetical protein
MTSFNQTREQAFKSLLSFILSYEKTKVPVGQEPPLMQVPAAEADYRSVQQILSANDFMPTIFDTISLINRQEPLSQTVSSQLRAPTE